ncbi:helicase-exonuclease AddAB subunit AddA [Caproiciproducens sp. NJN-50]|uniref:helicase-exonuclease AddAB subunit AddA n=1 Tax=Acutalibacteraceae TaxID=3082771 RepID=UPI000FFE25FF|nr:MULTISPECIES: helicase-exonuclease AddAB subunit AddA [Acutalibacteraceae]QAT49779.1 helicase-exonuclease AddAB subunit AddA [Caproiciproducens sp. NJN-50]
MSRNWTQSQKNAIHARGGALLVSAAAGSGKTAVLVQRVIERITDPVSPVDADRMLVVTFTKAAAAEMNGRIAAEIASMLENDPGNVRLQRQQILLSRAKIGTIDSFCSDLVRENFFKLGIAPDFRILDNGEMAVLRSQTVSDTLDEFYAEADPSFFNFVEEFSSGRDDGRIAETVNRLYDFVRSHPFPGRWLSQKSALYDSAVPAEQTVWGRTILSFAEEAVEYGVSVTQSSLARISGDEELLTAYSDAFRSDLADLTSLGEAVASGDWELCARRCADFSFPKFRPVRGRSEDPLKNSVADARKEIKAMAGRLSSFFSCSREEWAEEMSRLAPCVRMLFRVTERFGALLAQRKTERRAADFSDLEHWALKLLVRDAGNGFERTPDALELSERYEEIMVDEYQDTNEAQDMIFRAISRGETNLFLVGDVKQSIYRFRQAMPQIFLRRRAVLPDYDPVHPAFPSCVVLDRNFRSRSGVTGAVNFVFRQLMSKKAGELDYTKSEELVPGADYPPEAEPSVDLEIIDLSGTEFKKDSDLIRTECLRIADLIYSMTSGSDSVTDHGRQRPAVYRDFCILLRSANQYAPEYAKELSALGIPAWADTAGGFFAAGEIRTALSLLQAIDNPMQDIPLLAVMMSPIYGFTPDEVSEIRLHTRAGRLYPAVAAAARDGDGKAAGFLGEIKRFRTLAATMPSDRLIRSAYARTGLSNLVQAMPNGELRLANLRLLLSYARKYESSGYNGLSGFLRFLERMQRRRADLSAASTISESANVVRVMSVHHSKGLEFPICILAGCSRGFHKERSDVLLHPELGPGIRLRDPATGARRSTMVREAVALEQERDEMSEELRVLYVAMTRAKEKLILVTTLDDARKTLRSLASRLTGGERIPPYVVRGASSISDWLLLCALRHPEAGILRDMAGVSGTIAVPDEGHWSFFVTRPKEGGPAEETELEIRRPAEPDAVLLARLESDLNFAYSYSGISGMCAKVAASELAAGKFSARYAASSRPAFLGEGGLTPAERGTALHAYLQFADYRGASADPERELSRLVEEGFLTSWQAQAVDLGAVGAFFRSGLAKRILASSRMEREFRFSVEIPAGEIRPGLTGGPAEEAVILQGAVDCVFEEPDGLVIVDYKTDRTRDPSELWMRYREQLEWYRRALEICTEKEVKQCLLYSFALGAEITGNNS